MFHFKRMLFALALALPLYAAEPFTFVQLADTQLGMGGYEHDVETFKLAVKQINALNPDFVVICGDLINDTNDDQAFVDFKDINAGFTVPCYYAPGNHDVGSNCTQALLDRYRDALGKDYYAVDHKDVTVVIVNTQLWKTPVVGETEKHDAWLRETLAKAKEKKRPVFIVGHHPLFLKTPDEEDQYYNLPLAVRQDLLDLYESHGVVAVLTGHCHKIIVNDYTGIQMVTTGTTSRNFDNAPMGLRIWEFTDKRPYKHTYIPIEGAVPPEPPKKK